VYYINNGSPQHSIGSETHVSVNMIYDLQNNEINTNNTYSMLFFVKSVKKCLLSFQYFQRLILKGLQVKAHFYYILVIQKQILTKLWNSQ